jgi:hypothetical protein
MVTRKEYLESLSIARGLLLSVLDDTVGRVSPETLRIRAAELASSRGIHAGPLRTGLLQLWESGQIDYDDDDDTVRLADG